MKQYAIHPAAAVFPKMSEERFQELVADIKAHGLIEPISVRGNEIIDGRHRFEACPLAGVNPRFEEFFGEDAEAFIISKNLRRRDLTPGQRAAIVAELATLKRGTNRYAKKVEVPNGTSTPPTLEEAAKKAGVSRRSVARAKKRMHEDPAAHEAAKRGEKPKRKPAAKSTKSKPPKVPRAPQYSYITIAHEEGLLTSPKSGSQSEKLREQMHKEYPSIDLTDRTQEEQLRGAFREILAERSPEEAARRVAERTAQTTEGLTPKQRESIEKKLERLVVDQVRRRVRAACKEAFAKHDERLDQRQHELDEYAGRLRKRAQSIGAWLSDKERRVLLSALHPDKPDRSNATLTAAFQLALKLCGPRDKTSGNGAAEEARATP